MKFFFKLGGEIAGDQVKNSVENELIAGFGFLLFLSLLIFRIITLVAEKKAKKKYKQQLQIEGYSIDKDTAIKDQKVYQIVYAGGSYFKPQYELKR